MKYFYENNDKKNNNNKTDSIIKLSFINEKSCQKMQYILRKSKLKFNPRIIFKNEAPISTSLQKSRSLIVEQIVYVIIHLYVIKRMLFIKLHVQIVKQHTLEKLIGQ